MSISLEEVEHISELARLKLTPEEKTRFQEQLSAILDYANRLQELDTAHISPTFSVLSSYSALRSDCSQPGLQKGDLLRNAPQIEQDQFRVPPILE
jgi:aspartyl-tRNA(Asn)/glutamyl-tRNA(Gln) amidotransferase subunit C